MSLSRTISEINGDFSWKSQTPVYLTTSAEGFTLELGIRKGHKLEWWGYQKVKKV